MPILANIPVKKYDNTTDVTYVAVASAASDGVTADYQLVAGFTIPAARPTFKVMTRVNGKQTSRRVNASYKWPLTYTDPNGKIVQSGSINGEFSMILPQDVDPLIVREAHQQFVKLLSSAALRDTMDSGTAPR